jgi:Tfp pilus assembly protein PilF
MLGVLAVPAVRAQTPPTAAQSAEQAKEDSAGLVEIAALHARETARTLERQQPAHGRAARSNAGEAQYVLGMAWLMRDQVDSALGLLRQAVTENPNMARFHGDLAFGLAAAGHWAEAEEQYRSAIQLQEKNAWYYVGLGAAQVAQEHWTQAAASFTLAVNADSAVIVRQLAGPAGTAFQNAGMRQELEDWSRVCTVRFPEEPTPWLRLASAEYTRHDTVAGLADIRRYRSLRPEDPTGKMLYAEYLLAEGKNDSALAFALDASSDSSLRQIAATVLYNVGGHYLRAEKYDSAANAFEKGRPLAPATYLPQFDLYMGIAQLRVLGKRYNDAAQGSDCHRVPVLDSMLTAIVATVNAGASADTSLARQVLEGPVPQYRHAIDNFKHQCPGGN